MKNKQLIQKLFMERKDFIIIGLTGRTGSGCTTAASILESENPEFPDLNLVNHKGKSFYSGLDARRYEILKNYTNSNFQRFYSIKVSDLISAYLLRLTIDEAADFIANSISNKSIQKSDIISILESGIFKKTANKKSHKIYSDKIFDQSKKISPLDKELKKYLFYFDLIRGFTAKFKEELKSINNEIYINLYQAAGISIRRCGKVVAGYENLPFNPQSVFHLPETINRVIKVIKSGNRPTLIVIDAIRNPYEARFFKERYAAFYLISVNAPNEDRKAYLQNVHKFSIERFDELEKKESGKTKIEDADFISQNVKRCIEISDIHIFNPRNELDNHNVLKSQLAWYLALMMHPGLVTPTATERNMQVAYTAKLNSGCISRQVGAVITDNDNSIKAVGWNDVPKGQVPCSLRSLGGLTNAFDEVTYSIYERNNDEFRKAAKIKYKIIKEVDSGSGRNLAYCFKDIKNSLASSIDTKGNQVHTRSLHAEENAFLQLAKYGGSGIKGGKLYTTASPCELCSKKAYQLEISEIIYIDPYPGIAIDHVLGIGSNKPTLSQFTGAVGQGYHKLYEPVLPYKDELNYLEQGNIA